MKTRYLAAGAAATAVLFAATPPALADDTQCTGALTGTFDNVVVPEGQSCTLSNSLVRGNVKALPDSQLLADSNEIRGSVEGDKADQFQVFDTPGVARESVVGGNIQAKEGGGTTGSIPFVRVCGNELPQGDIQIERFAPRVPGGSGFLAVGDDTFCVAFGGLGPFGGGNTLAKGSIKVEKNTTGAHLGVDQNQVGGNLQVFENAFQFSLSVHVNQVGGNLQVFKNTGPGPKTVTGNVGGGDLQCFDNSPPFLGAGNIFPKEEGQCS
jgi:hypothetical protein